MRSQPIGNHHAADVVLQGADRAREGRALEEGELVERASHGDVRAYEDLVERYRDLVFRTAYLILSDTAEAEDATQEAFVKAYFALPRFRAAASFRPWLLQIAANEARNRRKAAARRAHLALRVAADQPPIDMATSPEAAALAAERRTTLLCALQGLREEDRLAIAYRYFWGLAEAETATALGCARGTVKSRLSRALRRLREQLASLRESNLPNHAAREEPIHDR
jgi:RNA polymerase sigma factor (sigma-70 family)